MTSAVAEKRELPLFDQDLRNAEIEEERAVARLARAAEASAESNAVLLEAGKIAAELFRAPAWSIGRFADDGALELAFWSADEPDRGPWLQRRIGPAELSWHRDVAANCQYAADSAERLESWMPRDLRTAVACAVPRCGRSSGLIAVYPPSIEDFDRLAVDQLETLAVIASTALSRIAAERALANERRLTEAVIEQSATLMFVANDLGRVERMNPALEKASGFRCDEIRDRALWGAFLLPEEVDSTRAACERALAGNDAVEHECWILTRLGQRRRIAWTLRRLPEESNPLLVGTGIDITENCLLIERLQQQSAAAAVKALPAAEGEGPPEAPKQRERRSRPRKPYPYVQGIAPVMGERMPDASLFRQVRCRDISENGFSYLSPVRPEHTELIAALGNPQSLFYLRSKIVHVTPTRLDQCPVFHIGCRYLGRAEIA